MSGTKSPKTLKAMELLKDKRLTNKQIALRCGLTSTLSAISAETWR